MDIFIKGHSFVYEIENVARMFLEEVALSDKKRPRTGDFAYLRLSRTKKRASALCYVSRAGQKQLLLRRLDADASDKQCELALAVMLYNSLSQLTRAKPPWGVLTGIRPAKYARMRAERLGGYDEVKRELEQTYLVSESKALLSIQTAQVGGRMEKLSLPNGFSLYVSIPFCPTRCAYCSFVSKTVGRDRALLDSYLECLFKELANTGRLAVSLGLRLQSVYVGGGTPSVLSAQQLAALAKSVEQSFDLSSSLEYTVECGRPDTVTAEKLAALKAAGVGRISINPQSYSDDVLRAIGRSHTCADTEHAFELAEQADFKCVNADLIAGLPLDTPKGFEYSLGRVLSHGCENITVHALTLKRASNMNENRISPAEHAREMVDCARNKLALAGYSPYYMYKQKATVENLENVGYSLPGAEGVYNVFMMDEVQTVLSCGAGAVTKLVDQKSGLIQRVYNYKYPAEYIADIDGVISRKRKVVSFYEKSGV